MPTPTAAALSSLILQQINFMIHHRSTIYKQSVRLKGNDDNVDLIHLQIRVSIHPSAVKAIPFRVKMIVGKDALNFAAVIPSITIIIIIIIHRHHHPSAELF
jgi:hypothetical protein